MYNLRFGVNGFRVLGLGVLGFGFKVAAAIADGRSKRHPVGPRLSRCAADVIWQPCRRRCHHRSTYIHYTSDPQPSPTTESLSVLCKTSLFYFILFYFTFSADNPAPTAVSDLAVHTITFTGI